MPEEQVAVRVADELRRSIDGGALLAGMLLPPREVTSRFAVSRACAVRALRLLKDEGLVAGHGSSTRVRQGGDSLISQVRRLVGDAAELLAELEAMAPPDTRMRIRGWRLRATVTGCPRVSERWRSDV